MSLDEAQNLQEYIYQMYPLLPVEIKTLGNSQHKEYACVLLLSCVYYLWTAADWSHYEQNKQRSLYRFKYHRASKDELALVPALT